MTAKLSEIWLKYALDDLQSAKVLLKEGIYNMVCFHSQQAVEILLKSFIATPLNELFYLNGVGREYRTGTK